MRITGEYLYERYVEVHIAYNITIEEEWEDLDDTDRAIWDELARITSEEFLT